MILKKTLSTFFLITIAFFCGAQVCTVTGTGTVNWPTNGSGIVCAEGGNAVGKTTLVIPAGLTVVFDNGGDTWTGTRIDIYGTMRVTANPSLNTSITVQSGGLLNLQGKLALGAAGPGCNYDVTIASGGTVLVDETAADRLVVCGTVLMKGLGACNTCGGTLSGACAWDGNPYCEPVGGFQGPLAYDKNGYNASLPVKLLYFDAHGLDETVSLNWATNVEENFLKFVIQHSYDGVTFENIGEVLGRGFNIYDIKSQYLFIHNAPLRGFNYYRLKAIDLDGSYENFGVRMVKVSAPKEFTIFPNPAQNEQVFYRLNFSPAEDDRVIIYDATGAPVLEVPLQKTTGTIYFPTPLPPGVYLLRYEASNFSNVKKLIVTQ